ncbi:MAG: hypothetical protein KA715_02855 [Xanthomonadaceae bacterium]|nr:hypothetical protein [Xanthomonadaceae bacterium]
MEIENLEKEIDLISEEFGAFAQRLTFEQCLRLALKLTEAISKELHEPNLKRVLVETAAVLKEAKSPIKCGHSKLISLYEKVEGICDAMSDRLEQIPEGSDINLEIRFAAASVCADLVDLCSDATVSDSDGEFESESFAREQLKDMFSHVGFILSLREYFKQDLTDESVMTECYKFRKNSLEKIYKEAEAI